MPSPDGVNLASTALPRLLAADVPTPLQQLLDNVLVADRRRRDLDSRPFHRLMEPVVAHHALPPLPHTQLAVRAQVQRELRDDLVAVDQRAGAIGRGTVAVTVESEATS